MIRFQAPSTIIKKRERKRKKEEEREKERMSLWVPRILIFLGKNSGNFHESEMGREIERERNRKKLREKEVERERKRKKRVSYASQLTLCDQRKPTVDTFSLSISSLSLSLSDIREECIKGFKNLERKRRE